MIKKNILLIFGFSLLLGLIIATFPGDSYFVSGPFHDIWIPQLSAYAIKSDLILHQEFHTPFGLFYSGLNYISLLIIEAWPKIFSPFDMTMLSSGFFALIIISLFYLMRLSTKKGHVLPYFMLLFALATVFQLKEINAIFDLKEVFWYAMYNTHMWAILILQISYAYCWLQSISKNKIEDYSKSDWFLFAFIQVICAYITFHYKISFFVASGAIAGSLFFFFSHRIKIRYVITYSLLFLVLIFMTWLMSNYSYLAYFRDIYHVLEARSGRGTRMIDSALVLLFGNILLIIALENSQRLNKRSFVKTQIHQLPQYFVSFFKNLIRISFKKQNFLSARVFFHFLISVAIFLAMIGDTEIPELYALVFFFVFVLISYQKKNIRKFAYLFLSFMIISSIAPLWIVASLKYYTPPTVVETASPQKMTKYREMAFHDGRKEKLILKNYNSEHDLYSELEMSKYPQIENNFTKFSYSYRPVTKDKSNLIEYIQGINEAYMRIKIFNPKATDKIFFLGFANYLPLLLNSQLMKESYHWIHLKNSFSEQNIERIHKNYQDADFLYMPVAFMMNFDRVFLNCDFYRWNFQHERFDLHSVNQYGLLFIAKDRKKDFPFTNKDLLNQAEIELACESLKNYIYHH